jgi:hypothetical protein
MIVSAVTGVRMLRSGEESIRLEHADAEDERERQAALRGADDARVLLHAPDAFLERVQPPRVDQVALVEQDDVAVTQLIARSLALEQVKAEAAGVRDRDDGIDRVRSRNSVRRNVSTTGKGSASPVVSTTR